jgi:hypothetical protein
MPFEFPWLTARLHAMDLSSFGQPGRPAARMHRGDVGPRTAPFLVNSIFSNVRHANR